MKDPLFNVKKENTMKTKLISLLALFAFLFVYSSCDTDMEALEIQKLKTYDEQYYANIRAYKKSDHCLSFGWYAAYTPIEGVDGFKDPASWGERIKGLPDSLDICTLWMGIPSNDPTAENYMPIAYADMRYVQEKLGTRFLSHADASNVKIFTYKGVEYDLTTGTKETLELYGQSLIDDVLNSGIDGIDLDYEPNGAYWTNVDNINALAAYIGKYFGPQGIYPDKIFTIDFYSHYPPKETEPYVSYFIRQAYTQGFTAHSASRLQGYYNSINWTSPNKFIVTENFGSWYENGGSPFTEADGNIYTTDGSQMYSLEGMARWNPTQGKKAGFGAFYFDRDYFSKTGIPYYNMRRCIQIANPAIKK